MHPITVFLLFSLSIVSGLNFCTDANIEHETNTDYFPGQFCWYDNSPETIIRVDIEINDNVRDITVYRLNQQLEFTNQSSRLSFSVPWIENSRTCCRHRYVYDVEKAEILSSNNSFTSEYLPFSLNRTDNYNKIKLLNTTYISPVDLSVVLQDYDQAESLCPLPCSTPADVVILLDASGSIDSNSGSNGTNWRKMKTFVEDFTDRFAVSPFYVRIGMVYFAGYQSCSTVNSCRTDDFCLPIPGLNRTTAQSVWTDALTDNQWMDSIDWLNPLTTAQQYSCWNGTTRSAGYASVELYISDNGSLIYDSIQRINNNRAYISPKIEYTAIGSGITLSKQLFERAVPRSTVGPKILVLLTDGENNCGEPVYTAADQARESGIDIFVVGIGTSVNQQQLLMIAGNNSDRVFNTNFDSFANILDPIVSITCTSQTNMATDCLNCSRLCTQCGECVTCKNSSECVPCDFCVDGSCTYNQQYADDVCSIYLEANQCQTASCNPNVELRDDMCELNENLTAISYFEQQCPDNFDIALCRCQDSTTTTTSTSTTTTGTPYIDDDDDDPVPWWTPLPIILGACCLCCCLPLLCLLCLYYVPPLILCCCCLLLLPFLPLLALFLLVCLIALLIFKSKAPSISPLTNGAETISNIIENPLSVDAALETMNPLSG